MAGGRAVKKATSNNIYSACEELIYKSMDPTLPIPQRQSLNNRAQELRTQWIDLEAARFNTRTAQYKARLKRIDEAVGDLRKSIRQINDAIKIAEKASKVFGAVDSLLKGALKIVVGPGGFI